jgi:hypothetical protein
MPANFRSWNKGTQSWLAFYVYKRLPDDKKMNRQVKKIIVMATSALWHGLYPGQLQYAASHT